MQIAKYIDHTLLKPTATCLDIEQLCKEALQYRFHSVCVNSCYVSLASELLKASEVNVCSVVGFPLGAMSTRAKLFEAERALTDGTDEIDMVMNIGWLKSKRTKEVLQEISFIKKEVGNHILKVILETCYLDEAEKKLACKICVDAGADFVKTSTGFGSGGATIEDIKLMKNAVKGDAKIKASGGIRDRETALEYIYLGVDRIGTSNSIAIVTGGKSAEGY